MPLQQQSSLLAETAKEAALSVGEQLRAAFRTTMVKDFKRDMHDIVTVHDKASEEQIIDVILSRVPDSTIVGEEGGRKGNGEVHWYIDPIDGTSNFSRGIALWCVSIAAVLNEQVVAGVIYNPVTSDLFHADLTGSWLNERPLVAEAAPDETLATIVSSFPAERDLQLFGDDALASHGDLLTHFQAVRNLGSGALNLAHVAAGWADATMGFSTSPWDVAAGVLILEQAGGRYHGFTRGTAHSPSFLGVDYYAVGQGADYPTLRDTVVGLSAGGYLTS